MAYLSNNLLSNMPTKEEFIEHFNKGGRPTAYNEKKHIPLLYEAFDDMGGIFAFCNKALVTRRTFYNWLKEHTKFKEAYEIALCVGATKWEKLPLENPNINHAFWMTVMKNRFGYYKPQIDIKPNATPNEKIEAIWEGIKEGELSAQEATQLASVAVVQSNIENGKVDDGNPFRTQTPEEIKAKAEALERLLKANKQLEEMEK